MLVVLIGGVWGGLLGLLLAIPVAACVKILLEEVVVVAEAVHRADAVELIGDVARVAGVDDTVQEAAMTAG